MHQRVISTDGDCRCRSATLTLFLTYCDIRLSVSSGVARNLVCCLVYKIMAN